MNIDMKAVTEAAKKELADEVFRNAVEVEKERLTSAKWWNCLFPFVVTISRRK